MICSKIHIKPISKLLLVSPHQKPILFVCCTEEKYNSILSDFGLMKVTFFRYYRIDEMEIKLFSLCTE